MILFFKKIPRGLLTQGCMDIRLPAENKLVNTLGFVSNLD